MTKKSFVSGNHCAFISLVKLYEHFFHFSFVFVVNFVFSWYLLRAKRHSNLRHPDKLKSNLGNKLLKQKILWKFRLHFSTFANNYRNRISPSVSKIKVFCRHVSRIILFKNWYECGMKEKRWLGERIVYFVNFSVGLIPTNRGLFVCHFWSYSEGFF